MPNPRDRERRARTPALGRRVVQFGRLGNLCGGCRRTARRACATSDQDTPIGQQHRLMTAAAEAQRSGRSPPIAGRVVALCRRHELADPAAAGGAADDQHAAVRQPGRRMAHARTRQRCRWRPPIGRRIVALYRGEAGILGVRGATNDEDGAIAQQRRRVAEPRRAERRGGGPGPRYRIVPFGRGGASEEEREAADEQYLSIRQEGGGMTGAIGGQRTGGGPAIGARVIALRRLESGDEDAAIGQEGRSLPAMVLGQRGGWRPGGLSPDNGWLNQETGEQQGEEHH